MHYKPSSHFGVGAEENINAPVYGQWVVTPPNDDGEEEVKVVSACMVNKED